MGFITEAFFGVEVLCHLLTLEIVVVSRVIRIGFPILQALHIHVSHAHLADPLHPTAATKQSCPTPGKTSAGQFTPGTKTSTTSMNEVRPRVRYAEGRRGLLQCVRGGRPGLVDIGPFVTELIGQIVQEDRSAADRHAVLVGVPNVVHEVGARRIRGHSIAAQPVLTGRP